MHPCCMQSCLRLSATQVATEATSLMYTDSSMVGVTWEARQLNHPIQTCVFHPTWKSSRTLSTDIMLFGWFEAFEWWYVAFSWLSGNNWGIKYICKVQCYSMNWKYNNWYKSTPRMSTCQSMPYKVRARSPIVYQNKKYLKYSADILLLQRFNDTCFRSWKRKAVVVKEFLTIHYNKQFNATSRDMSLWFG